MQKLYGIIALATFTAAGTMLNAMERNEHSLFLAPQHPVVMHHLPTQLIPYHPTLLHHTHPLYAYPVVLLPIARSTVRYIKSVPSNTNPTPPQHRIHSYLDKKYEIKKDPLSQETNIAVENADGKRTTLRIPRGVEVTEQYAQKAIDHEQELSEQYPGVQWRFVMCTLSAKGKFCRVNCYSDKLIHFVRADGLGDFAKIPDGVYVTEENVRSVIENAGKQVFTPSEQLQDTKE